MPVLLGSLDRCPGRGRRRARPAEATMKPLRSQIDDSDRMPAEKFDRLHDLLGRYGSNRINGESFWREKKHGYAARYRPVA